MSAQAQSPARVRWDWRHGLVVALVLALVASKWDSREGFTALLRFGQPWHGLRLSELQALPVHETPESGGYDGQFYSQLAVEPMLESAELDRALDAPAYRARRMFLPWTAAVVGLGDAWRTINAYALLNLAAWLAFAWLVWREIGDASARGFARWVGCVLSLGALESMRQSLVDLPALAFVVWFVRLSRSSDWRATGGVGACAALTKETALLACIAALSWRTDKAKLRLRSLGVVVMALLPLTCWLAWIAQRFGRWSETGASGNFAYPGLALVAQARSWAQTILAGEGSDRAVFGLIGVGSLCAQAAAICLRPKWSSAWWRVGMAHVGLMLVLGPWVWSGYWAAARALLPLALAFNLLLVGAGWRFWTLWMVGNATLLHGLIRFL